MSDKIVSLNGGKPSGPRSTKIILAIPDVDDPSQPVTISTEGGNITLPEVVYNLVAAANMLTLARPMPEGD